jgi:hypothetical protein
VQAAVTTVGEDDSEVLVDRLGMARIYGQNKGSWLKCHVIIAPLDLERNDIRR